MEEEKATRQLRPSILFSAAALPNRVILAPAMASISTEPRQMHNSVYLVPELLRILYIKPKKKKVTELES